MSLNIISACEIKGMKVRKHIKKIYGWGMRAQTVIDLNKKEKRLLSKEGTTKFGQYLKSRKEFPVPAFDISKLRPISRETILTADGKTGRRCIIRKNCSVI